MITIKKFSRPDCRPCVALANYLSEMDLAKHDAELVDINIADHPEAVEKHKFGGVEPPVLIFFRNGLEVTRLIGLRPVEEIIDAIEYAKVVR